MFALHMGAHKRPLLPSAYGNLYASPWVRARQQGHSRQSKYNLSNIFIKISTPTRAHCQPTRFIEPGLHSALALFINKRSPNPSNHIRAFNVSNPTTSVAPASPPATVLSPVIKPFDGRHQNPVSLLCNIPYFSAEILLLL